MGPANYLKESVFSATYESMKVNGANFDAEKHTIKVDFAIGVQQSASSHLDNYTLGITYLLSNIHDKIILSRVVYLCTKLDSI